MLCCVCVCVCTVYSSRPVRIDEIRAFDDEPGLRDYEVSFLRLMDKLSNGCAVQINETGEFACDLGGRRVVHFHPFLNVVLPSIR